jgi:hypothetical protein
MIWLLQVEEATKAVGDLGGEHWCESAMPMPER